MRIKDPGLICIKINWILSTTLINILCFLVKLGLTERNTEPEEEDCVEDGEEDDVDENEEDDEKMDEEVLNPQVGLLSFQFIIATTQKTFYSLLFLRQNPCNV